MFRRLKNKARWLPLVLLLAPLPSYADWVAKDATGGNITFESFTSSGKILQKTVTVDTGGLQVGVLARPLFVQFGPSATLIGGFKLIDSGGTNAAAVSALGRLSVDGSGVTQPISGTITSNMALSGLDVNLGNPIPTNCVSGCFTSESFVATYVAAGQIITQASATDIISIRGSATKVVKIRKIIINAIASPPLNTEIELIRRTTANTGGTLATAVIAQNDTTDPAPTAAVTTYTANPTSLGTYAGTFMSRSMTASFTDPPVQAIEMSFGQNGSKAILLRDASEYLSVNQSNTATSAITIRYSIEWTEE